MLKFNNITYRNFLSSGNVWTSINLDKDPMTLVVGANGAGKSTMLDAICFVLFNKSFRKFNKSDVVNSINKKDCEVNITFEVGKDIYFVCRGVSPAKFVIAKNAEPLEISGAKDAQEVLEGILGFNYKTFTQIAILGSSSFVPFMKLTAADRRALIEDLLDIQIFSAMSALVKDKTTSFNNDMGQLEIKCIHLHSKIESLKKAEADNRADHQKRIDECLADISKIEDTNKHLKLRIAEKEFQAQGYLAPISEQQLRAKLRELQTLKFQIDSKVTMILKNSDFYVNHEDCPTCKQEITEAFRKAEIDRGQDKVKELSGGLKLLTEKIATTEQTLIKVQDIGVIIMSLQRELAQGNEAIKITQKSMAHSQKRISETTELGTDIAKATCEWESTKANLATIKDEQRYYSAVARMLKDDGIKSKVVKQYLPVINKTVNDFLKSMDFFVNIEFDEQFNEVIKSRHRDKFTYEHFSEGERMRLDLALLLTWRTIAKMKANMDTNLLILDEVFDSSLDEAGVDGFMSILESWDSRNVIVISHKGDVMADKFNNIIRFEKVDNFSRIVT